ncbi:MAG: hypothetical protein ACPGKR_04835 [Poseidonia sp.]
MNDELPKVDPLWEQPSTQPDVGHLPPAQNIAQPAQPQPAMPAMGQAPSSVPTTPPPTQYIQGQMQPMMGGTTMVPQQVMYIPLTYKPTNNYRTISYIVLGFGFIASIFGNILAEATGSYLLMDLSSLVCCGSFTAVLFLDAAYYKGKADWQMANGMPNTGSTASLVIESIFGIICAIFFVLILIGMFVPV